MRVAVRPCFLPGASGGVEQYVQGLARGLGELDGADRFEFVGNTGQRASVEPFIHGSAAWVTLPSAGHTLRARFAETAPGGVAIRVRQWARRQKATSGQPVGAHLPALVEEGGYDVVHFATQMGEITALPNLYQPWDLQHRHFPQHFTHAELEQRELIWGPCCRRATYVIVASNYVRDDVAAAFGVDPARIALVPPGPPLGATGRDSEASGPPYALFPAQTWAHKNHERLIDAVAVLRARGTVVRLVCPGQPNARDDVVREHARSRGVADLFELHGYVSDNALADLYAGARCLAFPSLFEGFGFPVLEAFAAGVPVACADATSLPELARGAAVLFDPTDVDAIADAIERVWTDEALRADLVAKARVRAERYSWDHLARSCRALYRAAAETDLTAEDSALLTKAGVRA